MTQSGRGDLVKKEGVPGAQRTAAAARERGLSDKQAEALKSMLIDQMTTNPRSYRHFHLHHGVVKSLAKQGLVRLDKIMGTPHSNVIITDRGRAKIREHTGKSWIGMDHGQLQRHVLNLKRILHDAKIDQNTPVIEHITKQLHGIATEANGPAAWRLQRKAAILASADAMLKHHALDRKRMWHGEADKRTAALRELNRQMWEQRHKAYEVDTKLKEWYGRTTQSTRYMNLLGKAIHRTSKLLSK